MTLGEHPVRALAASDQLSQNVIGEAMYVHRVLGPGFLESIYQNALLLRLRKTGIKAQSGSSLPVHFDGEVIGNFQTDIVVEGKLLLELKAVSVLNTAHEVQLVNYLTATQLPVGLLLNFGGRSLEIRRRSLGCLDRDLPLQKSILPINPIQNA